MKSRLIVIGCAEVALLAGLGLIITTTDPMTSGSLVKLLFWATLLLAICGMALMTIIIWYSSKKS